MIVNKNDFHCFLKKVNNGLVNFNEVIVLYRARSNEENTAFHIQHFEENKIPNLNFFGTIDPTKILFLSPHSQSLFAKKPLCKKNSARYNSADKKKHDMFFLEIILKGFQKLLSSFY